MGQVAPALWDVLEGFPMGGFQGLRGLRGPCQECQVRSYVADHCHKPRRLSRRLAVGEKPGRELGPHCLPGDVQPLRVHFEVSTPNHWVVTGEFWWT